MEKTNDGAWQHYPALAIPTPVLDVVTGTSGIWVGGTGGIAWQAVGGTWQTRISGLPLSSVTTLNYIDGWLFAGGAEGIARSLDGGKTWQAADIGEGIASVLAMVASPDFTRDRTLLAATLESGVIRSDDGGKTWKNVNFGLQSFEVNALLWREGETVLAATADGVHRSTNGGRAWRLVRNSEEYSFISLLEQADGTILAASETEGLFFSKNSGTTWEAYGEVAEGLEITGLWQTEQGALLLGTSNQGLLRSTDEGATWDITLPITVLALGAIGRVLYAGTSDGVSASEDDGSTWQSLPYPPVHDLRRLILQDEQVYLAGVHTGLLHYRATEGWQNLPNVPYPLTTAMVGPEQALFAASLQGLQRSTDGGQSWKTVITGEPGNVAHLAFRADGTGCAGSADGSYLHCTRDGGKSWQGLTVPFGILPLSSLLVTEESFVAVNYDPRQFNAHVWRSLDNGKNWHHELDGQTNWPIVSTYHQPPLMTMADSVLVQEAPGNWKQVGLQQGGIRRVVGNGQSLFILSTQSIQRSDDGGQHWTRQDEGLPIADVMDIAATKQALYVLLTGGRVWTHTL